MDPPDDLAAVVDAMGVTVRVATGRVDVYKAARRRPPERATLLGERVHAVSCDLTLVVDTLRPNGERSWHDEYCEGTPLPHEPLRADRRVIRPPDHGLTVV